MVFHLIIAISSKVDLIMMKFLSLSLLLGLVTFCESAEKDVVELGDSDFKDKLSVASHALVMFYAPWCGHCKRLKPEFAKAAESLLGNDPAVGLFKVDCTEAGKATCSDFNVNGYPTLKIFKNGEVSEDYNGPRDAAGIVKYMKSKVGPASKPLKSVEDVEDFTSRDDASVIGFFEESSKLKKVFDELADKMREDVRFGFALEKAIHDKFFKDKLVLFRPKHLHNKFEDKHLVYSGDDDVISMRTWIQDNFHGLVGHRRADNAKDFPIPLLVAYYSVDYQKNPKGTNYWRNRILKTVQNHKEKFTYAISSKDEFQHELNECGIEFAKGDVPVVCAKDTSGKKYVLEGDFSMETLEKFIQDFHAGLLTPYIKSEAVPEDNTKPVKTAVAKNFQEVVPEDKDVLIEFYAPWCGHCKKLTPIYEELGTKMEGEEVNIVKMDATANDVPPEYEVHGFPTLYWKPKGKSPVKYEGGRDLEDFVSYIAKHSTDGLKGYDRKGKATKSEL